MKPLAVFNDNHFEPTDYADRPTVKAIILNDQDQVFLFSGALPGGGVETGETNEAALARECMEEIGATVTLEKELGMVIQYRDLPKRKYIFYGYQCSLVSVAMPTTTLENEIGKIAIWEKRTDAIARLENEVATIKSNGKDFYRNEGERYQAGIFNRETAIVFLKAIG